LRPATVGVIGARRRRSRASEDAEFAGGGAQGLFFFGGALAMKIRSVAPWILVGCLAPHAFAGWTRFDEPSRIVPGAAVDGGASCSVEPMPESIRNRANGTGGHFDEYTVTCHGNAERRSKWRYVPEENAPSGWASVEARAQVDGQFYVRETPMSLAHDTRVEVRCPLLPNGMVKAEITDSRQFTDSVMAVSGTAMVVGSGGMLSTTVFLSGIPQMFFYAKVEDANEGATCIDAFTVQWRTEGDAFLWVDDGLFLPGSGNYSMHGDSITFVAVGVCPDCNGCGDDN
jgi:hypothetical protein